MSCLHHAARGLPLTVIGATTTFCACSFATSALLQCPQAHSHHGAPAGQAAADGSASPRGLPPPGFGWSPRQQQQQPLAVISEHPGSSSSNGSSGGGYSISMDAAPSPRQPSRLGPRTGGGHVAGDHPWSPVPGDMASPMASPRTGDIMSPGGWAPSRKQRRRSVLGLESGAGIFSPGAAGSGPASPWGTGTPSGVTGGNPWASLAEEQQQMQQQNPWAAAGGGGGGYPSRRRSILGMGEACSSSSGSGSSSSNNPWATHSGNRRRSSNRDPGGDGSAGDGSGRPPSASSSSAAAGGGAGGRRKAALHLSIPVTGDAGSPGDSGVTPRSAARTRRRSTVGVLPSASEALACAAAMEEERHASNKTAARLRPQSGGLLGSSLGSSSGSGGTGTPRGSDMGMLATPRVGDVDIVGTVVSAVLDRKEARRQLIDGRIVVNRMASSDSSGSDDDDAELDASAREHAAMRARLFDMGIINLLEDEEGEEEDGGAGKKRSQRYWKRMSALVHHRKNMKKAMLHTALKGEVTRLLKDWAEVTLAGNRSIVLEDMEEAELVPDVDSMEAQEAADTKRAARYHALAAQLSAKKRSQEANLALAHATLKQELLSRQDHHLRETSELLHRLQALEGDKAAVEVQLAAAVAAEAAAKAETAAVAASILPPVQVVMQVMERPAADVDQAIQTVRSEISLLGSDADAAAAAGAGASGDSEPTNTSSSSNSSEQQAAGSRLNALQAAAAAAGFDAGSILSLQQLNKDQLLQLLAALQQQQQQQQQQHVGGQQQGNPQQGPPRETTTAAAAAGGAATGAAGRVSIQSSTPPPPAAAAGGGSAGQRLPSSDGTAGARANNTAVAAVHGQTKTFDLDSARQEAAEGKAPGHAGGPSAAAQAGAMCTICRTSSSGGGDGDGSDTGAGDVVGGDSTQQQQQQQQQVCPTCAAYQQQLREMAQRVQQLQQNQAAGQATTAAAAGGAGVDPDAASTEGSVQDVGSGEEGSESDPDHERSDTSDLVTAASADSDATTAAAEAATCGRSDIAVQVSSSLLYGTGSNSSSGRGGSSPGDAPSKLQLASPAQQRQQPQQPQQQQQQQEEDKAWYQQQQGREGIVQEGETKGQPPLTPSGDPAGASAGVPVTTGGTPAQSGTTAEQQQAAAAGGRGDTTSTSSSSGGGSSSTRSSKAGQQLTQGLTGSLNARSPGGAPAGEAVAGSERGGGAGAGEGGSATQQATTTSSSTQPAPLNSSRSSRSSVTTSSSPRPRPMSSGAAQGRVSAENTPGVSFEFEQSTSTAGTAPGSSSSRGTPRAGVRCQSARSARTVNESTLTHRSATMQHQQHQQLVPPPTAAPAWVPLSARRAEQRRAFDVAPKSARQSRHQQQQQPQQVWNGVLEATPQQQQLQQLGVGRGTQPRGAGMLSARQLHGSYSSNGALGLGLAVLGGSLGYIPAQTSAPVSSSSVKGETGGNLAWAGDAKAQGVTSRVSPRRTPAAASGLNMSSSSFGGNTSGTQIQAYGVLRVAQPTLLQQQQQHLLGAFGPTAVTSSAPAYAVGPRASPRASPRAKSAPIRGHTPGRGYDPALQVTAASAGVLLVPQVTNGAVAALHVQSSSGSNSRGSVRPVVPMLNLSGVVLGGG